MYSAAPCTMDRILQGYTVWLKLWGPFKDDKRESKEEAVVDCEISVSDDVDY
jgi:hypothetical protein